MASPPTLSDIAKACGVSVATASKALNPHADRCDIAAATRERVVAVAARLGWQRDTVESSKRRKRYGNLGLMWNRYAPRVDSVYEHLIENAAEVAAELGFHILFTPLTEAGKWREMQLSQRLDGVVAIEAMHEAVLAELEASRYPAVLLNLESPHRLHQILVDEADGAAQAIRHLHGLGHRHVLYLPIGIDWHYCDRERIAGLEAAARACGLRLRVGSRHDPAGSAEACAARGGPTAVVAFQDTDIPPLLRALRQRGLEVPGRVSVMGIGDVRWFQHLDPQISSVSVPIPDMIRLAVQRVAELVASDGSIPPRRELLPGSLHQRGSTGPAPRR